MAISHRDHDSRVCGATTTVVGQDFVNVDGKLWAVKNDTCTHGDGQLINSQDFVFISGKPVILVNDDAQPDDICLIEGGAHCDPKSSSGSSLVTVG